MGRIYEELEEFLASRRGVASEQEIRGFLEDYAHENGLVRLDSCAKCTGIEDLTVHHVFGKDGILDDISLQDESGEEVRGGTCLEATRIFLGYGNGDRMYYQLKRKGKIYLCDECHQKFNAWYRALTGKHLTALVEELRTYEGREDFSVERN